ncbi:MAG TPA: hypothetical protein VM580_16260, partial [Labilithrix sp.]|nr:hypothetical protein [Labilithrix sp.]
MVESIRASLPPVYRHLVNDFFDRPKVIEGRATCDNCAMCDHGQKSPVAMEFFHPDTKCCTFHPNLANYLVGSILADKSPAMAEGKKRIRAIIKTRVGVAPQFLSRPRKLTLIMSNYSEAFGRAKSLLCPFYDGSNPEGACTIWKHRESVCMTYYCKYSGGKRGFSYWTALKRYLFFVEALLARSAAHAIDPRVKEPRGDRLTLEDIEDLPAKDADYRTSWQSWVGREEVFYLKCHEWVSRLSPKEFAKSVDGSER